MDNSKMNLHDTFWLPSLEVLSNMESMGIYLDCDRLHEMKQRADAEVAKLHVTLNAWSRDYLRQLGTDEMNWNSPAQVLPFIHDYKGYPISPVTGNAATTAKNNKKARTTSESALLYFKNNARSGTDEAGFSALLQAKTTAKLAQFMEKLPTLVGPDNRLRCSIGPGTDTGRLNSSNPNLQQIPSRNDKYGIRSAFTAAPGKLLVVADYSQLEMYVIAHFLIHWFNDYSLYDDLSGGDVHTNTAFRVWGGELRELGATHSSIKESKSTKRFRDYAKTVNYAVAYGKTAAGLGAQIKDAEGKSVGKEAGQKILDTYFAAYPGLVHLFERWRQEARDTGYVRTLLGRTRPLPDVSSTDKWPRLAAERRAVNTPVQGSAADIVTSAMLRCNTDRLSSSKVWFNEKLHKLGAKLIMQIHDELIFEVPEENAEKAQEEIVHCMEHPFSSPLKVQLKVDSDIGRTWADAK